MQKRFLFLFFAIVPIAFFTSVQAEVIVSITTPENGSVITPCIDMPLKAEATATAGETVKEVRFYLNGKQRYRDRAFPWQYTFKSIVTGVYEFTAKAIAADGLEYWSDPVKIKVGPVSAGEKLFNGNFSCGKTTGWTFNIYNEGNGSISVMDDAWFDDQYYLLYESEAASTDWYVQLAQTMPIDSGHVYEIYFLADADDARSIVVGCQEAQDPYATEIWQTVDIETIDEYGPFEFTATKSDPTNLFKLCFGASAVTCYIDDIRVIDRSMSSVKEKRLSFAGPPAEFELEQAYPNPFNMDATIRFSLSEESTVSLQVFNMRGQKVRTLVDGQTGTGRHTVQWNGLTDDMGSAPSGLYLYRLVGESLTGAQFNLSRKIVLLK